MAKSTHVIEEYSVSQNTIVCVCRWEGDADEYQKHRNTAPPTDRTIVTGYESKFQPHRKVTISDIIRKEYTFE